MEWEREIRAPSHAKLWSGFQKAFKKASSAFKDTHRYKETRAQNHLEPPQKLDVPLTRMISQRKAVKEVAISRYEVHKRFYP